MYKLSSGIAFTFLLFSNAAMATCPTPVLFSNGETANATVVYSDIKDIADCLNASAVNFSGNVGIGATPADLFQVGDFTTGHIMIIGSSATTSGQIYFGNSATGAGRYQGFISFNHANNNMIFGTAQNNRIVVDGSGNLFPDADSAQSLGRSINKWSTVYAANGAINTSDRRLKKNIADLENVEGLSAILKLRPVTFQWKNPATDRAVHYGFIAQEVKKALPKAVEVGNDSRHTLGLNYSALIPSVVKAIQELNQKTKGAKDVALSQSKMDSLVSLVRRQQARIDELQTTNSNALTEIALLRAQVNAIQRKLNLQTASR
jgi:hypothetical protein